MALQKIAAAPSTETMMIPRAFFSILYSFQKNGGRG